jgi:hypothetical protein
MNEVTPTKTLFRIEPINRHDVPEHVLQRLVHEVFRTYQAEGRIQFEIWLRPDLRTTARVEEITQRQIVVSVLYHEAREAQKPFEELNAKLEQRIREVARLINDTRLLTPMKQGGDMLQELGIERIQ